MIKNCIQQDFGGVGGLLHRNTLPGVAEPSVILKGKFGHSGSKR